MLGLNIQNYLFDEREEEPQQNNNLKFNVKFYFLVV